MQGFKDGVTRGNSVVSAVVGKKDGDYGFTITYLDGTVFDQHDSRWTQGDAAEMCMREKWKGK